MPPPPPEDLIHQRVRELLNELHHKTGYRTAMIQEIASYIRAKLREDARRGSR